MKNLRTVSRSVAIFKADPHNLVSLFANIINQRLKRISGHPETTSSEFDRSHIKRGEENSRKTRGKFLRSPGRENAREAVAALRLRRCPRCFFLVFWWMKIVEPYEPLECLRCAREDSNKMKLQSARILNVYLSFAILCCTVELSEKF